MNLVRRVVFIAYEPSINTEYHLLCSTAYADGAKLSTMLFFRRFALCLFRSQADENNHFTFTCRGSGGKRIRLILFITQCSRTKACTAYVARDQARAVCFWHLTHKKKTFFLPFRIRCERLECGFTSVVSTFKSSGQIFLPSDEEWIDVVHRICWQWVEFCVAHSQIELFHLRTAPFPSKIFNHGAICRLEEASL